MNEYYMQHWQMLRNIEGAAQRVQEDTMRFAATLEDMGVKLLQSVMTLIAFLPVLVALSPHVKSIPILGEMPYGFSGSRYCLVSGRNRFTRYGGN